jgi:hypothetical protein
MAEPDEDDACIHAESLAPRLLLRHGAAGAADVTAAAYDACQQTLALALSNGSVQLFRGAGGAQECTLASGCTAPTLALHFLRQSPYLLRVSVQSDIELWDLRTLTLEASTLWAGDVTAACVLPGSPFVLLGEADGALRCACLRNGAVTPRDFEQSYGADCGALVALALQPEAEDGRVLVAHSSGRVSILDLATRDTVLLGACGSELTCCAWADTMTFLTGHASGALRFWSLPEAARGWRAPPQQPEAAVQSGELLCDEIEQLTSARALAQQQPCAVFDAKRKTHRRIPPSSRCRAVSRLRCALARAKAPRRWLRLRRCRAAVERWCFRMRPCCLAAPRRRAATRQACSR